MRRTWIAILAAALALTACSKGGTSTEASRSGASGAASATSVASPSEAMSGPLRLEGTWKVTYTLKEATKGTLEKGTTMLSEMTFQPQCESGSCEGTVTVTDIEPASSEPMTYKYHVDGDTYTWQSENPPHCTIDGHTVNYSKYSKIYRITVSGDAQGSATSLTGTYSGKATASDSYKGQKCLTPFVTFWDLKGTPT